MIKDILRKFTLISTLEVALLFSMLLTLMIPSNIASILPWSEISFFLYIRAVVWIFGLSLLPGFYVLNLTSLGKKMNQLEKVVVGLNLSFAFLGVTSFILYYFEGAFNYIQWVFLFVFGFLVFFNWYKNGFFVLKKSNSFSRWHFLLLIGLITSICLALYFQLGLRYLLPGDIWISLKPSVQIFSQVNVYEAFKPHHYPLMFGFILSAFSVCSGLPLVNVYALLFPLVGLNLLSFYVFVKHVFNLEVKTATLAAIIYGFGSGIGILIQYLGYGGDLSFMTLSSSTRDFSLPNFFTLIFFHKSLALTQAFTSIVSLLFVTKLKRASSKIVGMLVSILLILFAFYLHMLEGLIFMPLIPIILFKNEDKWFKHFILYVLLAGSVMVFLDFFMQGYYFWLSFYKIIAVLNIIGYTKILFYSSILLVTCFLIFLIYFFSKKKILKLSVSNRLGFFKVVLIGALLIIYVSGLLYWDTFAPSESFPWYRHVTRYGFFGVLALIGIYCSKWRESKFFTSSLWGLYIILVGSFWWEARFSSYLVIPICFFAALGIFNLLESFKKTGKSIVFRFGNNNFKVFKLNINIIVYGLIGCVFLLSFSSTLYGSTHYFSWDKPCISDDTAKAFDWINVNIPKNNTVLVPNIYNIYKGINTICDRDIYIVSNLPENLTGFIEILKDKNVRYAFTFKNEPTFSFLGILFSQSKIIFQLGDVLVYELPDFTNSSTEDLVSETNDQLILLNKVYTFKWKEDNFTELWKYQNINSTGQEEILTLNWTLNELYVSEPYVKRKIPLLIDTDITPYLVVKYRNLPDSSEVSQIITLINQTGYPDGFVKNYYLPISETEDFNIFIIELPQNQMISDIWFWMRNWQNLNGTTILQIDYIGFVN